MTILDLRKVRRLCVLHGILHKTYECCEKQICVASTGQSSVVPWHKSSWSCKEKAIIISFPNHIFSRLQPLDRSVHGPFKNFVNRASDACIKSNPGKTMTIYDTLFIVCQAVPNSLTPKNIKSGNQWQEYGGVMQICLLTRISCLLLWMLVNVKIWNRKVQFLDSQFQIQKLAFTLQYPA